MNKQTYLANKRERKIFNEYCWKYGLFPEDYGMEFISCGTLYKIIGYDVKLKRFKILNVKENRRTSVFDCVQPHMINLQKRCMQRGQYFGTI